MRRIGYELALIAAAIGGMALGRRMGRGPEVAQKPQLAYRTMHSLEDIIAANMDAWHSWSTAMGQPERSHDTALVLALGRLGGHLATIERLAKDARNGRRIEAEGELTCPNSTHF